MSFRLVGNDRNEVLLMTSFVTEEVVKKKGAKGLDGGYEDQVACRGPSPRKKAEQTQTPTTNWHSQLN